MWGGEGGERAGPEKTLAGALPALGSAPRFERRTGLAGWQLPAGCVEEMRPLRWIADVSSDGLERARCAREGCARRQAGPAAA